MNFEPNSGPLYPKNTLDMIDNPRCFIVMHRTATGTRMTVADPTGQLPEMRSEVGMEHIQDWIEREHPEFNRFEVYWK